MSNRTLIEINHDFAGEIARNPDDFMKALLRYLHSIEYNKIPMNLFPGVRVLGARHHSEPYVIHWGAYTAQVGLADLAGVALGDEERAFLAAMAVYSGRVPRSALPPNTRAQDRARQRCRREGWAVYGGTWGITDAGRAMLAADQAATTRPRS